MAVTLAFQFFFTSYQEIIVFELFFGEEVENLDFFGAVLDALLLFIALHIPE